MTGTPEPTDDLPRRVQRALSEPADVDVARREAAIAAAPTPPAGPTTPTTTRR